MMSISWSLKIIQYEKRTSHIPEGQAAFRLNRCFDFPGFVPAYIRPLFCEGKGPFRWAALSGDPQDIAVTDELIMEHVPGKCRFIAMDADGQKKNRIPGITCPHRLAWPG